MKRDKLSPPGCILYFTTTILVVAFDFFLLIWNQVAGVGLWLVLRSFVKH